MKKGGSKEIYIEKEDFREEANKKFFRLKLGKEVRLKNAYFITANSCTKDEDGNIIERIPILFEYKKSKKVLFNYKIFLSKIIIFTFNKYKKILLIDYT